MMYTDEAGKKRFRDNVRAILLEKENDEILAMLENTDFSDLVDCDGQTLLHLSVKYSNEFFIRYLIGKNVDINAVDCEGNTPFMLLASRNTRTIMGLDIWKIFIDAGADLCQIKNKAGRDALWIARNYCFEFKKAHNMIEQAMKTRYGSSAAIADALIKGDYQICDLYVFPDPEVKRQMLVRGCDVNFQNPKLSNNTALHLAAMENHLDDIKLLLEFGADKNIMNKEKLLPIDEILRSNSDPNREAIELLIPDSNEWVDRQLGYEYFGICSVEWLKNFLKPFATTKYQLTQHALCSLMDNENQEVWSVLQHTEPDLRTIDYRVLHNNTRQACYSYGYDTPRYLNILHTAMLHNRPEAVQFLLNKGADVDVLDSEGRSPLFYNATLNLDRFKSMECVKILLRKGANVQLSPKNGDTIVSHLIKHQNYDALDIILCHLAILEARGSTLDPHIMNHIDSSKIAKDSFAKCKQELDEIMKKGVVYWKLLTCKEFKIWKFVQNDDVVQELSECKGATYLHRLLIERFERGSELDQMRKKARQLIIECVELFKGHELIIEIILDFLHIDDLKLIAT